MVHEISKIKSIITDLKKIPVMLDRKDTHLLMFQQVLWSVYICNTGNCDNYIMECVLNPK